MVFDKLAADFLAAVVDEMVVNGHIDSRSKLSDARLNYGDPFSEERRREILSRQANVDTWSKDLPTDAGYYWYYGRINKHKKEEPPKLYVARKFDGGETVVNGLHILYDFCEGHWLKIRTPMMPDPDEI